MLFGKVIWYNSKKGFGFIMAEDGTSYFFHKKNILMDGNAILYSEENVNFEVNILEDGRTEAISVSSLDKE